MGIIGKEIHLVDRIFGSLAYPILYFFKRSKYRIFLGEYNGGKGIVTIKYKFFDWGKFAIDGVEPKGERWNGKYSLSDNLCLIGKYRWNVDKNISVSDVGQHTLYISEDGTQIKGTWENLTGSSGRKGAVDWKRLTGTD